MATKADNKKANQSTVNVQLGDANESPEGIL
jgi:hypothetical protein